MSSQQARTFSKPASRGTTRLTRHLEKNLLAYATAAGAGLSLSLPAEAEVVFTPSNTPMAIAVQNQGIALTLLDLNNDGHPDFGFIMSSTYRGVSTATRFKFCLKISGNHAGNEAVVGTQPQTAAAVAKGKTIGPNQNFGSGSLYLDIFSFNGVGIRSSGTWRSVDYAYVGLKFLINGQVHYGWVRVKFPLGGETEYPSIYGYAYETTPNTPIVTGQTSGTTETSAENAPQPATLGVLAAGAPAMYLWRGPKSAADAR